MMSFSLTSIAPTLSVGQKGLRSRNPHRPRGQSAILYKVACSADHLVAERGGCARLMLKISCDRFRCPRRGFACKKNSQWTWRRPRMFEMLSRCYFLNWLSNGGEEVVMTTLCRLQCLLHRTAQYCTVRPVLHAGDGDVVALESPTSKNLATDLCSAHRVIQWQPALNLVRCHCPQTCFCPCCDKIA